jgi:hypothetical protein
MTSKQLAYHVLKGVTKLELSAAPINVLQELLDGLNLALATWLNMLPQERRGTTFGGIVRAPVTQPVSIVSQAKQFAYVAGGSAYPVGGYASEEDALGCSVYLPGMAHQNQLMAPVTLLYPFLGSTSSNAPMTMYGDAVHLPDSAWAVEGTVSLIAKDGAPLTILAHNPNRAEMIPLHPRETGSPREWWMESLNPLTEADSRRFVLRIWPLPTTEYVLRVPVGLFPRAFKMDDIFEDRSLPFQDIEGSLFTTFAKSQLVGVCSSIDPTVNLQSLMQAGGTAFTQLESLVTRRLDTTQAEVGTPYGW